MIRALRVRNVEMLYDGPNMSRLSNKYLNVVATLHTVTCYVAMLLLVLLLVSVCFEQSAVSQEPQDVATVKVDENTRKKFLIGGVEDKQEFDRSAPVRIGADSLVINAKERIFTYKGKVEAFQNDLLITSEVLEGTYDAQNQLEKIICRDHVVITRGNRMQATANRAEYDVKANIIVLTEGPEVVERTNALSADKITLYIDEDRSEAQGRVRVKLVKSEADALLGSVADVKKGDGTKDTKKSDSKDIKEKGKNASSKTVADKKLTDKKNSKGK